MKVENYLAERLISTQQDFPLKTLITFLSYQPLTEI